MFYFYVSNEIPCNAEGITIGITLSATVFRYNYNDFIAVYLKMIDSHLYKNFCVQVHTTSFQ